MSTRIAPCARLRMRASDVRSSKGTTTRMRRPSADSTSSRTCPATTRWNKASSNSGMTLAAISPRHARRLANATVPSGSIMAIRATLSSEASLVRSEASVEAGPREARSALRATA